jgi:hypothetical protein
LTGRAAGTPEAPEARFAQILDARLTLLAGDTAATLAKLQDAVSRGRFEALEWGISEALAPERLLLAELLLATGKTPEALSVAAIFDHQAPATFLPFLPASLVLRERAALALGRKVEAKRYAERLSALGQGADPSRGFQSPSTVEAP